jgi:ComF family protein
LTRASWAADVLDFLLPTGCVVCRKWIPTRDDAPILCAPCRTRLREATWPRCSRCHHPRGTGRVVVPDCLECREWPPELTAARYAYVLEAPAVDLVHALKYEGWREAAYYMGGAMAAAFQGNQPSGPASGHARRTIVVPVPTTPGRERTRGYNQAHLLAERFAGLTGLPLYLALTRTGAPRSQTSLSPAERSENVRGAFGLAAAVRAVRGAHVVLVDDVLTTGATAGEAAVVLVGGGAARVTLVAFARALPSRPRKAA